MDCTHCAIALTLLALAAGLFTLVYSTRTDHTTCKKFSKGLSFLIIIVAFLQLLCVGYQAISGHCLSGCHKKERDCHKGAEKTYDMDEFMKTHPGMNHPKTDGDRDAKGLDEKSE